MTSTAPTSQPNPAIIFDMLNAYQRSAALKAAIDLDLFTVLGSGKQTAAEIAKETGASERGIRILCDYLAMHGLLTKSGGSYAPSLEASTFLDRKSPAYFGSAAHFLLHPTLTSSYQNLAEVVRNGRTSLPDQGTVS